MYNVKAKIGAIIPANNSVLEPEFWSRMPPAYALYATRLLVRGDLTAEAVKQMESGLDASVDQLAATGVDVLAYMDMVTTFIMNARWNEQKTEEISGRIGVPCISAWTALRDALVAMNIRRIALGTPYPRKLHGLARPFFEENGFEVVSDGTLDIVAMREVPNVTPKRLQAFVQSLEWHEADAVVLLATDLPTLDSLERLEKQLQRAVLSSNQTLLWASLRQAGYGEPLSGVGRLGSTLLN